LGARSLLNSSDTDFLINEKMPLGCINLNKIDSEVVLYVQQAQANLE